METRGHTLIWIGAILVGLGLAGGLYWNTKRTLTKQYDQAERRADSLLSVTFQLEGDTRDLMKQLESASDETDYLENRIDYLHEQVGRRDRSLASLRRNKAGQADTIHSLTQKLGQLATTRDSLENQMAAMHDKINWQQQSNAVLVSEKNELEQRQKALDARILTMVPRSAMTGDAFLVEVSKANKKVTAKAKKAATLTISLTLPADLKQEGLQEVYVSLTNPQRKPIMPALYETTLTLPTINEVVPVHATQVVNFARNPQRISFTLTPETAIKPGIYQAAVYTKDAYLGAVTFQLRDSFWFF